MKNEKCMVSIIIPIYNIERYLERCLKSVREQSFTNFEVIMIDDNSSDRSPAIAQKFCDIDDRFILIRNEKNRGVSDCRNIGLENAKGKYIIFIDSDDYVRADYLSVLYDACEKNDADMAYCRFKYTYFNTRISLKNRPSQKAGIIDTDTAVELMIRDMVLHSYTWNKMYRRSLYIKNNISYPSHMYFEDLAVSTQLLINSNKLAVTDEYLYYYVKHFDSIMSSMNSQKINDYWRAILNTRNYVQLVGKYERYREAVEFLAKKAYTLNIYSIIRQHIINLDFRNMKHNLQTNKKILEYISSEAYKPIEDGVPELPFKITQPRRKKKKS